MFVIIGIVVVTVSVVGGYMFAGGDVILLMQPAEFIIIIGAAVGSLLISAPLGVLKKVMKTLPGVFKSHTYSKEDYLELLKAFNDLFLLAQRDGLLAIEKHVEKPEESDILSKNQKFLGNELAITFSAIL